MLRQMLKDAQWRLFQGSGPRAVPGHLARVLRGEFGMGTDSIAPLRCVTKPGRLAGRPVQRVLIYDPGLVPPGATKGFSYQAIEAQKQAIRFSGQVATTGQVHLSAHVDTTKVSSKRSPASTPTAE